MSYNFPSPTSRSPRPKRPRWGVVLILLIGGVFGWKRFSPNPPPLPTTVKAWREKLFPSPRKTENAPPSPLRRSQIPRVESLPSRGQIAVPRGNPPQISPRPSFEPPRVTPPAISGRETPSQPSSELTPSNLPLRLPGAPQVRETRDETIRALEAKIAKYPVFALYRALAARHLQLGNTNAAARVIRTQAALFRRRGLEDAALILEGRAAGYETTLRVFAPRAGGETAFTGAPLEPKRGCYLGAFIDRDDALRARFAGDNFQYHHLPSEFEARVGRRHASVFTYVKWGNFPRQWLSMCKREGVIPHIAWEPGDLSEVRDDAYLRGCAQFLRELDWPVFVRFAGEMNGDWTPYNGNPAQYRDKFRLVHRVLHRYAAKVATIWCPNAIPLDAIDAYYPGDGGCDWVGVNFYSTPFADNNRERQAFKASPLTLLDPIYRRYSARKPIAICEYAASHQSAVDGVVRADFALEKMSLLYGALPLLYPRVKLIDWFSSNNLIHARASRRLNNYRLTQIPQIQAAYRDLTSAPHFLTSLRNPAPSVPAPREIEPNRALQSGETLSLWVTGASARPATFVTASNRVIYAGRQFGRHVIQVPRGADSLAILIYDGRGRCVSRRDVKVQN